MSQLAIKGHPTRGSEVIALLEMLGGINEQECDGTNSCLWYSIDELNEIIFFTHTFNPNNHEFFTLEEFLEKYPYKIGDKIVIKKYKQIFEILSVRWCTERNIIMYQTSNGWYSVDKLQPYKEETMKVSEEFFNKYCKKCGSQRCTAEGEWLEGCRYYKEETMKELRIDFPEGYGYAGIENKQVIFTKIKTQYPKTYEECCTILNLPHSELTIDVPLHYSPTLIYLTKLLICRDAYWKIVGEQMGLGKPWEPDWLNTEQDKFVIYTHNNAIHLNCFLLGHNVLAFPTFEIRAMFYENFKELIEKCKKLL